MEREHWKAYCSTCRSTVQLTRNPGPTLHGQATIKDDGEVVCLDYGCGCSQEEACPVTGRLGLVMAFRLARSRLEDDRWPLVEGRCPACGDEGELKQLAHHYVYCGICETPSLTGALDAGKA